MNLNDLFRQIEEQIFAPECNGGLWDPKEKAYYPMNEKGQILGCVKKINAVEWFVEDYRMKLREENGT